MSASGRSDAVTGPGPIVHIGYHKTATTWFQNSVYPHAVGRRYVDRRVVQQALLRPSALCFDPDAARALLGAGDGPILCEENLSGYLHNGGLHGFLSAGIAERIRATLPDARIVMFVRAQPSMIAASYNQYVRAGGTHRPHRYLWPEDYLHGAAAEPWKVPRFQFDHFDYHRLALRYRSLFGADRVHVFAYEALAADRDGFLRDFAAALGLAFDWAAIGAAGRNASLNAAGMRVARLLNRLTARSVLDKRALLHLPFAYAARRPVLGATERLPLRRVSPERVLGADAVRWIERRYAESNAALADAFGLDLAAYGYPLEQGAPVERPRAGAWRRWIAR